MMPRVAIITVSFNHARFLQKWSAALSALEYPREAVRVFLVDNASTDDTVAVAERLDVKLPFELIKSSTNTGFTGGNNLAIRRAMDEGFDFVLLLNPDTQITSDFLTVLMQAVASDPTIAAAQPRLMLEQDRATVNSVGNAIHFLGFSFAVGNGEPWGKLNGRFQRPVHDVATISGATMLLSVEALRRVGVLDDTLFAYHEDLDLSLRLRLAGYRTVVAPESVIYHHYEFSRSIRKFYWMERNRLWVMLKVFRIPTLILMAPAALIVELGVLLMSIRSGWFLHKLRAYGFYFSARNWADLLKKRREVQQLRRVKDRTIMQTMVATIGYQEISNPILKHVGNPLMSIYWTIIRLLIVW